MKKPPSPKDSEVFLYFYKNFIDFLLNLIYIIDIQPRLEYEGVKFYNYICILDLQQQNLIEFFYVSVKILPLRLLQKLPESIGTL